jgi:hypothetical protein
LKARPTAITSTTGRSFQFLRQILMHDLIKEEEEQTFSDF